MIARANDPEGNARYALPSTWSAQDASDPLIFSISTARAEAALTRAYLRFMDAAIKTVEGQFLRRPVLANLVEKHARIVSVYRANTQPEDFVAARYVVPEAGGRNFAGGYVRKEVRGRQLSAAMGAIDLHDAFSRGETVSYVTAGVISRNGTPNQASVSALRKLGFVLGDGDVVSELRDTDQDRHLLAHAEVLDGALVLRGRHLHLSAARIPDALKFLTRWRG